MSVMLLRQERGPDLPSVNVINIKGSVFGYRSEDMGSTSEVMALLGICYSLKPS